MAKVFVSYSRKDIEFAKRLTAELQKSDLDFWIDWEGIPPTVDWWKEIEKGIEEADVFLFLISPDATRSQICAREIEVAVKNGKRLIPLVVRDVRGDETPSQLSHLNWIFFRENDDFDAGIKKLQTSINTDYEWVQNHRRLQVKALEWERNHKESSFHLRGKDLQDAEFQLAKNTSKEPRPTDLQREYVFESKKAADRQRRATTGALIGAAIVFAILGVFGLVQASNANEQASIAQTARADAELALGAAQTAQADAETARQSAIANEEIAKSQANIAATAQADAENALERVRSVAGLRAEALASLSKESGDRTNPLALLLAVEAYQTTINEHTTNRLFELLQEDLITHSLQMRNIVYVVRFSPDGDQLAAAGARSELKLWQVGASSEEIASLVGHSGSIYSVDFSPDGKTLASGAFDNKIILWDTQTREPLRKPITFENDEDEIFSVAFSPDGKWLVSGGTDKIVHVWDTSTWNQVAELDGHTDTIFTLAFSPDSKTLASGGRDTALIFWDMESMQIIDGPIKEHRAFLFNLTFSSDGKTLATTDSRGTILLWDVETRQPFDEELRGHQGEVSSVSFSPDAQWLASGGYDSQVILWDVANREQLAKLPTTDTTRIISVEFSPDGTLLATGNDSGAVTLWNMDEAFWLDRACEIATRNFTQEEWNRFFPNEPYRSTCSQWPEGP